MGMSRDYMLKELGIALLAASTGFECLVHALMREPLTISPHHHDSQLQFDLVFGAAGRVFSGERWLSFDGPIALAAYPGESHGYTIEPTQHEAMVFHMKMPVAADLACVRQALFARTAPMGEEHVWLRDVGIQLGLRLGHHNTASAAAVVEIMRLLAAWPSGTRSLAPALGGRAIHPLVEETTSLIESQLDEPPTLEALGAALGVSARHLSRVFQTALGMTPHRYVVSRRLDRAKTGLLDGERPIASVGDELGFSTPATFTRWFRHETGMTPSEFRSSPAVF